MRIHLHHHHHLFSQLLMQFLSWWCNWGDNKLGQLGTLCPTAIKRLYTVPKYIVPYTKQTWRSWCVCTPTHHAPLCGTWMHFVEALLSHSFSIKTCKQFRHRSWHLTVPALSPSHSLSLSPTWLSNPFYAVQSRRFYCISSWRDDIIVTLFLDLEFRIIPYDCKSFHTPRWRVYTRSGDRNKPPAFVGNFLFTWNAKTP